MEIPVTYKDIEINGRNFRLNKMDARTGSFMLLKLMKIVPTILKNVDLDKLDLDNLNLNELNLTEMLEPIFDLPEKEFRYIQDSCLKSVEELLKAGPQEVLNKSNEWGVPNLGNNIVLVMNLTIQELVFNLQGFFEGSPLSSIMKNMNLSQPNSQM